MEMCQYKTIDFTYHNTKHDDKACVIFNSYSIHKYNNRRSHIIRI